MTSTLNGKLKNFEKRQLIVSLLGLLILLCLSILFNYVRLSSQAQQTAKLISRMTQIEDFREVGLTLQEARLDHFTMIKYVSKDSRKSFTLPELAELIPDKSFWRAFSHDRVVIPVNTGSPGGSDQIIFEFSRFNEMFWAFLIWVALNLVSIPQTKFMKRKIIDGFNESLRIETELSRAEVAKKIRHNIRTPLSALMRLSARDSNKKDAELLSTVINQIQNLISDLDEPGDEKFSDNGFYEVLKNSMRELRLVAPTRIQVSTEVDDSLISASGKFVGHELRSIISNIAVNAFEAISEMGSVKVFAEDYGDRVLIEIQDSGKGITPDILPLVTNKGFSHEKPSGTGLGLSHAKECLESWGGSLTIKSEIGLGTTVNLSIPIQAREPWYVPRIKLRGEPTILILDDQVSVHEVWRERLKESGFTSEPHCFTQISSALEFTKTVDPTDLYVFADYDLGSRRTGLDFIKSLPQSSQKYLVTGHFDDQVIQNRCKDLNVPLIPKTSLSEIPIIFIA